MVRSAATPRVSNHEATMGDPASTQPELLPALDCSRRQTCNDLALRSWILGWGASARVLAPPALEADIRTDLTNASNQYRS